jgi:hypothetical protein
MDRHDGAFVAFYPQHEDVDWGEVIASSKRLDIVVHYYNRWVREHFDAFVGFFGRGGTLRIVMADPQDQVVLNVVNSQFFPNLTAQQLVERIDQTESELRLALEESGSRKAKLQVLYYPGALHYALVLSNERYIYLSVYEQFRGPVVRSSVFEMDLVRDTGLEEYWERTIENFIRRGRVAKAPRLPASATPITGGPSR